MTEPLTQADLERMRQDHAPRNSGIGTGMPLECSTCIESWDQYDSAEHVRYPCDAARLIEYIDDLEGPVDPDVERRDWSPEMRWAAAQHDLGPTS